MLFPMHSPRSLSLVILLAAFTVAATLIRHPECKGTYFSLQTDRTRLIDVHSYPVFLQQSQITAIV